VCTFELGIVGDDGGCDFRSSLARHLGQSWSLGETHAKRFFFTFTVTSTISEEKKSLKEVLTLYEPQESASGQRCFSTIVHVTLETNSQRHWPVWCCFDYSSCTFLRP
jgi:hypothetical protein